jgi:hypothetical protein
LRMCVQPTCGTAALPQVGRPCPPLGQA